MFNFAVSLFVIVLISSDVIAKNATEKNASGVKNENATPVSDNAELQNIKKQLETLMNENFILRQEFDLLAKRFDTELDSRKQEIPPIPTPTHINTTDPTNLSHITKTLDTVYVAVKPPVAELPTSCAEAMQENADHIHSGVYLLYLPDLPPFEALCLRDAINGSAWTVVQRRLDGSINFYRDWVDYKNGFGNLYGEFWLGLDRLHGLTKVAKQELWIYLEDFDGEVREARYDSFAIGHEKSKYGMHTLGNYSGDAGDSLRHHFNSKFSTRDSDNDNETLGGCAIVYAGAWWFNQCATSDLNAKYLLRNDPEIEKGRGIQWFTWRGLYSLKRVHMAIRPIKTV